MESSIPLKSSIQIYQKSCLYILFFPCYIFLLSFGVAIFLWKRPKENQITNLLTLFLLTCSLAYTSIGASSRGDIIGKMVIGYCIVFCLVLFIHFFATLFLLSPYKMALFPFEMALFTTHITNMLLSYGIR